MYISLFSWMNFLYIYIIFSYISLFTFHMCFCKYFHIPNICIRNFTKILQNIYTKFPETFLYISWIFSHVSWNIFIYTFLYIYISVIFSYIWLFYFHKYLHIRNIFIHLIFQFRKCIKILQNTFIRNFTKYFYMFHEYFHIFHEIFSYIDFFYVSIILWYISLVASHIFFHKYFHTFHISFREIYKNSMKYFQAKFHAIYKNIMKYFHTKFHELYLYILRIFSHNLWHIFICTFVLYRYR